LLRAMQARLQQPRCCAALVHQLGSRRHTYIAHADDTQRLARQLCTHGEPNAALSESLLLLADLQSSAQLSSTAFAQRED